MPAGFDVRIEGIEELERLPNDLNKFAKGIPRVVSRSISQRLRYKVSEVLRRRGVIGATGKASNVANWRATTRKVGDTYESAVRNLNAPYVAYLDEPFGPYPLLINDELLLMWMRKKGISPNYLSKIKLGIMRRGHQSMKGIGFSTEAVMLTLNSYQQQFGVDVDSVWNQTVGRR